VRLTAPYRIVENVAISCCKFLIICSVWPNMRWGRQVLPHLLSAATNVRCLHARGARFKMSYHDQKTGLRTRTALLRERWVSAVGTPDSQSELATYTRYISSGSPVADMCSTSCNTRNFSIPSTVC
jgi:hypothetical protein